MVITSINLQSVSILSDGSYGIAGTNVKGYWSKKSEAPECQCEKVAIEPHVCPYKADIEKDETLCTCCDHCAEECSRDR